MSNLTSFALASIFSFLSIWAFYFLIKKWSKFHITLFGKVLKVFYALILLLAIALLLTWTYISFTQYWEDDRLRVVSELQGVKLGWTKDEVYFRKGQPKSVEGDDSNKILEYGSTGVFLENDKVVKIIYICQTDGYDYEKIGGISCNSDIDRVLNQYGESKKLEISSDKLSRIYNYPQYNLTFGLSSSKVDVLGVFDSAKVPGGLQFSVLQNKVVDAEKYANWIVANKDKKGTPEFETVANAYEQARAEIEPQSEPESPPVLMGDEKTGAGKDVDLSKLSDAELLALQKGDVTIIDHCAPNLKKSERLRRLALMGTVRETGYQTYTVGNYEISFSANDVISCR